MDVNWRRGSPLGIFFYTLLFMLEVAENFFFYYRIVVRNLDGVLDMGYEKWKLSGIGRNILDGRLSSSVKKFFFFFRISESPIAGIAERLGLS